MMLRARVWNQDVTWGETGFQCPSLAAVATLLNVTMHESAPVEEWAARYFPSTQDKAAAVIEYYGGVIVERTAEEPAPQDPEKVY
ncbi:MAG: hypothetical protein E6R03_02155 [Hyphomicrobiaceae bacterium]|nr:MAG: hypothetical protein E6R03_02155 [Hyphomicrobiaceae bacterium]